MIITRPVLNIIASYVKRTIKKRRKFFPPYSAHRCFLDVAYMDDKKNGHRYDIYLSKSHRKNVCIIDIHGGSYMFSESTDNYPFANEFLKNGYDVVCVDYVPNNGKRDTLDLIKDCVSCINHLIDNLDKYGLDKDSFVISGDSAGGHFALLISEAILNKEVAEKLGLDIRPIKINGILVNGPVYDFELMLDGSMSNGALNRMFGKGHHFLEHMRELSPRTYVESITVPLFVSTCTNDFIRTHSVVLKHDYEKMNKDLVFVDIESDEPNVDHVHNVVKPNLLESRVVNLKMMEFIDNLF